MDPISLSGHRECMPAGRSGGKASVQLACASHPAHVHVWISKY